MGHRHKKLQVLTRMISLLTATVNNASNYIFRQLIDRFIRPCRLQPVHNELTQWLLTINIQILRFNTLHNHNVHTLHYKTICIN